MLHAYPLTFLLLLVTVPPIGDALQRERIEQLEKALLAPCCYSEPVSRHRSEVALQMRAEIADWVAQGKSDREILDHYKQLYGARVLLEPEGSAWWLVYLMPGIAAALGLWFTVALLRKWRARTSATPRP
jgi:cytochrome c-type biogenesis protein CcmH/NrfF